MSTLTVEAIKRAIADLKEEDKVSLTAWLNNQTMDEWDREMDRDFAPGGQGHHLVEKLQADIRKGRFQPLTENCPPSDE